MPEATAPSSPSEIVYAPRIQIRFRKKRVFKLGHPTSIPGQRVPSMAVFYHEPSGGWPIAMHEFSLS